MFLCIYIYNKWVNGLFLKYIVGVVNIPVNQLIWEKISEITNTPQRDRERVNKSRTDSLLYKAFFSSR